MQGEHPNSIISFYDTVEERAARRKAVLDVYLAAQEPLTDRDVVEKLGFKDMNAARPRISEMVTDGVLIECGKIKDKITKRLVRITKIRQTEFQPVLF